MWGRILENTHMEETAGKGRLASQLRWSHPGEGRNGETVMSWEPRKGGGSRSIGEHLPWPRRQALRRPEDGAFPGRTRRLLETWAERFHRQVGAGASAR